MKKLSLCLAILLVLLSSVNFMAAQQRPRDKGIFMEYKNEFLELIRKEADKFKATPSQPHKSFKVDLSGYDLPKFKEEFTTFWHNPPVSQGLAGTCWSFSTTSFLESEIYRIHKKEVKLSQLYTVYWEYVEKARYFVQHRGNSVFDEGSEGNAVTRIWKKYGIIPLENYTGLKPEQKFHDHSDMATEMKTYLNAVKQANAWNEEEVVSTVRAILKHYVGEPPSFVMAGGERLSPQEYLQKVLQINPDDYVDFMSLMENPYYQQCEYDVPDNWWHSSVYYNIPLPEFMEIIKRSIRNGYTIAIGGDVSEPGIQGHLSVAMVPSFDIPSEYIDEHARQLRFTNKTTADDHGIHLVGYQERNGVWWFLIKDSGSSARNSRPEGYYFYHEDYVKLKMLSFMIHRSAVEDVLKKFSK